MIISTGFTESPGRYMRRRGSGKGGGRGRVLDGVLVVGVAVAGDLFVVEELMV